MAQIVINEISQNYQYSVANANFATVAMPITSCWGPAYLDIATLGIDLNVEVTVNGEEISLKDLKELQNF